MRNEKKYAVHPGYVISKNDGQRHFVNARQLRYLYQVMPEDCVTVNNADYLDPSKREFIEFAGGLIPLRPRRDGNYTLPTNNRVRR